MVCDIHKHLTKSGRNPIGKGGIYHIFGLVKFLAYKWLCRVRKDEVGRLKILTFALPTTYSPSIAKMRSSK